MRIELTESFQRSVHDLGADERAAVFDVLLSLPEVIGDPHRHVGTGLRKLHPSGVWEARIGLGLRLVFTFARGTATLVLVGNHDEVRRFLRSL